MKLPKDIGSSQNTEQEGDHEVSCESSKSLRMWLVAYGIGAPAFITHPSILEKVSQTGNARLVGLLFLCGVALQVYLFFRTKISMWYLCFDEWQSEFERNSTSEICEWYSERFLLDAAVDLLTIVFFGTATVLVFKAFI